LNYPSISVRAPRVVAFTGKKAYSQSPAFGVTLTHLNCVFFSINSITASFAMPRNKALMKKRAVAPRRIVIKPFQKPPTLPPNYYEETSHELLEGTLNIIFKQQQQQQQQQSNDSTNAIPLSLQNSYQQVVNLVSHQYGPRLYQDLVKTLQRACQDYVLPSDNEILASSNSNSSNNNASRLLGYIQAQYQKYVEYLLLCKHVFLPMDRAHGYISTGAVVKRSVSGGATTVTVADSRGNKAKNAASAVMDLWQVGLEQFQKRLHMFQWDDLIYQKWWESLQLDWEYSLALDQQTLLQTTLYMWQDLGVVASTLSRRLEPDLIGLFQSKSEQLQQASMTFSSTGGSGSSSRDKEGDATMMAESGNYNATAVISYCFDKWMHVAYHWSRFLPKSTCVFLLENHLFKPHLTSEWLLNPKHFDPILEEAFAAVATATPSAAMAAAASTTTTTSSSPIQQLWMLAGRLPGGYKLVGGAIAQYARTRGMALMSSMNRSDNSKNISTSRAAMTGKQKIADLLQLQRQVQQLLSQLSHSNEYCQLKPVWEDVVNPSSDLDETNMVAEALAKYVDTCLRDNKRQLLSSSSSSSMSPLESNGNWAEAVISGVFCFLQAKDVFEAFYKQDLAKRLLWNRIVSMDVERHFVSLLKAECGAGYTSKMEGMFQDMDWSRETMSRYKQTQFQDSSLGSGNPSDNYKLEIDIQVLTTGYWPVYPQYPNLNLPQSVLEPQERFTEYYKSKYQGRRMTWQYALGHLVVKFKPKETSAPKYELVVSLCQALTLLQFNEADALTLPQIMIAIGLEDRDEMERVLLSLSLGKEGTRVLTKRDHDYDKRKKTRANIHDQDKFMVQSNFKSNQRRIRITNILMKESKEEREKTVEAVSRDRLYLIDAVLVRIMKARKTILHQQLIPQVLEQVKVPAQPADIKKRIETLIEREYMERDTADRNRYNYLA
jgi:hypothetical protein